jgi:O-antigen ligase
MSRFLYYMQSVLDVQFLLRWFLVLIVGGSLGFISINYILYFNAYSITRYGLLLVLVTGLPIAWHFNFPIRRLLLAVPIVEVIFRVDVFWGWDSELGNLGTVAGLNISVTTIAILGLYAIWYIDLLSQYNPRQKFGRVFLSYPIVIYLSINLLSSFVATAPRLSYYEAGMLIQMLLLFIYIICTIRTHNDVLFIISVMFAVVIVEGGYLIFQRLSGAIIISDRVFENRIMGHFGSPNVAGSYFALYTPVGFGILLSPVNWRYKVLAALTIMVGSLGLFLTLSRGAWFAFIIAVTLFFTLTTLRGYIHIRVLAGLFTVGMIALGLFGEVVFDRVFGDDGGAAQGRVPLNELAIDMWSDNVWLGVGANNFIVASDDYITPEYNQAWFYTVHNKYLLLLTETGPFGLVAFLSFLILSIIRGIRAWLGVDKILSLIALSITCSILGHMMHMMFDIFNNRQPVQYLWTLLALITAIFALVQEKKYGNSHATEL